MSLTRALFRLYFQYRLRQIDRFRRNPIAVQAAQLEARLRAGRRTTFGKAFGLDKVRTYAEFQAAVPAFDYEAFKPWIERGLQGEESVFAPGRVAFYARSSGTTADRSKYIPITPHSIFWNHTLGMRDAMALYLDAYPQSKALDGKTLTLGGTCAPEGINLVGDLSGIVLHETARWGASLRTPDVSVALLPDFEQKIQVIAERCTKERVTAFAGVPSWNLELMRRVLAHTGKANLLEVTFSRHHLRSQWLRSRAFSRIDSLNSWLIE